MEGLNILKFSAQHGNHACRNAFSGHALIRGGDNIQKIKVNQGKSSQNQGFEACLFSNPSDSSI
jgi:hypothetical protein